MYEQLSYDSDFSKVSAIDLSNNEMNGRPSCLKKCFVIAHYLCSNVKEICSTNSEESIMQCEAKYLITIIKKLLSLIREFKTY